MMLTASNISIQLGETPILDRINLSIEAGQFKSIVGPNGAGKSTLLKVLTREYKSFNGDIKFHGKPINAFSIKEISFLRAVLRQQTLVNFPFTVHQIVALGRTVYNEKQETVDSIVKKILREIGFEHFAHRNYLTLSGGEKQKVQLARVLAQIWSNDDSPKLIFLDEPTTSLDMAQQHQLLDLVKNYCNQNIGIIAVIHDLNLAAQYSDEIIFLKNGRVVDQGPVQTVFSQTNIETTFAHDVTVFYKSNGIPFVIPEASIKNSNYSKAKNYDEQLTN